MKTRLAVILGVVSLLAALPAAAQRQRVSPHEQASATIGGKKITIDYGRPYLKGRKAVGGALAPYGQVWRTGADEATMLTTSVDFMIGDLKVPAGSYSLFTIPGPDSWTLIVNKTAKQWGAFKYEEATDLGRTKMKVEKTPSPVEQFTINIVPGSGNNGTLVMEWENTKASVPLKAL